MEQAINIFTDTVVCSVAMAAVVAFVLLLLEERDK
jgi:hypothetical protein